MAMEGGTMGKQLNKARLNEIATREAAINAAAYENY
jgi:hypothetical protein